jgi:uncharacterized membrane protein YdjX (TVP38/TMEM64 family)
LPPRFLAQHGGRIAAILAVALVLVLAKVLGVFDHLREPARLAEALVGLGAWGYLAFIVTYAVLQPFGIPGTVFVVAAALIWPWPVAFALSMTGTMIASVIGFSFARYVARDWVSRRIPARLRKYEEALAQRGFATVFVLRFVFWMPPILHAFLGISRVRAWTHFWASLLAYLLPLFLMSYFGQRVFDAVRGASTTTWIGVGIGVVVVALGAYAIRRRYPGRRIGSRSPATR